MTSIAAMLIDRRTVLGALPLSSALVSVAGSAGAAPLPASPRERIRLDRGWRFSLGHASDPDRDFGFGAFQKTFAKQGRVGVTAAALDYDDSHWAPVTLPHDWAVELPFVENAEFRRNPADKDDEDPAAAHGYKPLGRAFPETSVGWYRLTLPTSAPDGRRLRLDFDGVFRDAIVILNGYVIAEHRGGYTPFSVDATPFLNTDGQPDVLLVRADASLGEGWFYEGAGIYRHVWMVRTAPLHAPQWGVFVRAEGDGSVTADVELVNDSDTSSTAEIEIQVLDSAGMIVATSKTQRQIAAWKRASTTLDLRIPSPRLWSVDTPNLYVLRAIVREDGALRDVVEERFGVRDFRFDAHSGFFLNGAPLKIKGVNNHQDHAGVGAAIPDALQVWRLRRMKELGANAVRTAHNPPTPELLDACDELGLLVIDETRQMSSAPEPLEELRTLIRRDRNHPSIMLWSIGNEEPQQGTARGARIAKAMAREIRALDPTRKITAAMNKGFGDGVTEAIDVIGFNYHEEQIEDFRRKWPNMPIVGTETASAVSTRGEYARDDRRAVVSSYDVDAPYWGKTAEAWWRLYNAKPYLMGGFVWTGFDYRGEPTPFNWWPSVASNFGILDSCGIPKDIFYYYQSWWRPELPVLHLLPHWNWEGREGQPIEIWAYSNLDEVELFVNGRSLGRQSMPRDGHLAWTAPYAPGRIQAYGYKAGRVVAKAERRTAGAPARLALTADRTRLTADGRDVAVVNVSVLDSAGVVSPRAAVKVHFATSGGGRIIGVGNGDPNSHEADKASFRTTYNGWAQVILQTEQTGGVLSLDVRAEGLSPATLTFSCQT